MSHNTNMPQLELKGSAEGSFMWFVLTTPASTFTWVPGIELGPKACMASALPTEPFHQDCLYFMFRFLRQGLMCPWLDLRSLSSRG